MTNVKRNCKQCGIEFCIKPKGYNTFYCSKKCKYKYKYADRSTRLTLDEKRKARRKSYLTTRAHSDRYSKHLDSGRKSIRLVRMWLAEYKQEKGCIDCGYNKHSAALQLDHCGKKSAAISDLRSSIARLQKEIKNGKCVVRCAICHAVKTWAEKNGFKYRKELAK